MVKFNFGRDYLLCSLLTKSSCEMSAGIPGSDRRAGFTVKNEDACNLKTPRCPSWPHLGQRAGSACSQGHKRVQAVIGAWGWLRGRGCAKSEVRQVTEWEREVRRKEGVTVEELLCHLLWLAKPDWQQYKLPENSRGRPRASGMSDRTCKPRTSLELRPVITADDSHFVMLNGPAPTRLIPQRLVQRGSCQCHCRLRVAQITHLWGHPWPQREDDCSSRCPTTVGM